ncbi:MAG: hypothetical protein K0S76_1234 [Herbinix sp.]|nr:hypothetical protein [Herbinix sp.]
MSEVLYGIGTVFLLRMKLIGKDVTTRIILITSVLLFAYLVFSLSESAAEQSSLPIGIVDKDKSNTSEELIFKLKKVPSIKVIDMSEEELYDLLLDEMIMSYFIIEEDYEQKVQMGDLEGLISAFYKEDNKAASILADIVAGEMMYTICYYKSYQLYQRISFSQKQFIGAEYRSYMDQLLMNVEDFNFAFQMHYQNDDYHAAAQEEKVTNTILYQQLIVGILGILIALIAMFVISQAVQEKENRVEDRLKLSGFHFLIQDIGNMCALLVTEGTISFLFCIFLFTKFSLKDGRLFLSVYLLLLLNSVVLGGVFLLFTKVMKSMIIYQLVGSTFILITGGLGYFHLLSGLYQSFADKLIKFIPNSWFIQGITDIIIYGNSGGYIKVGHRALAVMAGAVFALMILFPFLNRAIVTGRIKNNGQNRMVN